MAAVLASKTILLKVFTSRLIIGRFRWAILRWAVLIWRCWTRCVILAVTGRPHWRCGRWIPWRGRAAKDHFSRAIPASIPPRHSYVFISLAFSKMPKNPRSFRKILENLEESWRILEDLPGFFRIFQDFSGFFRIFLDFSGFFWIPEGSLGFQKIPEDPRRDFRTNQDYPGFSRIIQDFIELWQAFWGFSEIPDPLWDSKGFLRFIRII